MQLNLLCCKASVLSMEGIAVITLDVAQYEHNTLDIMLKCRCQVCNILYSASPAML